LLHYAYLIIVRCQITCPPSPCGRLSRPQTTTRTPWPWGSRPVGHPVLHRPGTSEREVGRPLIPLGGLTARCVAGEGCRVPWTPKRHGPPPSSGALPVGVR